MGKSKGKRTRKQQAQTLATKLFAKKDDVYLKEGEGQENDLVIAVMGPTGVGKSTFINNVLQAFHMPERANTSDGFASCTAQLQHFFIRPPSDLVEKFHLAADARIVLVDTPGFDDTNLSDTEILRRIAIWLALSYTFDMKVAGIVYMYPIYPNRITRNDRSNLKVFQKICGKQGLSKVILATTRWEIVPEPSIGLKREAELQSNFWKDLIDPRDNSRMAIMMRAKDEGQVGSSASGSGGDPPLASAHDIVEKILARYEDNELDQVIIDLQNQLVDKDKDLKQTEAAQELRRKLQELLREAGNADTEERKKKLQSYVEQAQQLKIGLGDRFKSFFRRK